MRKIKYSGTKIATYFTMNFKGKLLKLFVMLFILPFTASSVMAISWWDLDWNRRVPIYIQNNTASALSDFQVPVDLSGLGSDFWDNVNTNGNDICVIENSTVSDSYWFQDWNHITQSGTTWIRRTRMGTEVV